MKTLLVLSIALICTSNSFGFMLPNSTAERHETQINSECERANVLNLPLSKYELLSATDSLQGLLMVNSLTDSAVLIPLGQLLKISYAGNVGNIKHAKGELVEVRDSAITLVDDNNERLTIPLNKLTLIYALNDQKQRNIAGGIKFFSVLLTVVSSAALMAFIDIGEVAIAIVSGVAVGVGVTGIIWASRIRGKKYSYHDYTFVPLQLAAN